MVLGRLQGGACVPDSEAPVVKLKRKPKKKFRLAATDASGNVAAPVNYRWRFEPKRGK